MKKRELGKDGKRKKDKNRRVEKEYIRTWVRETGEGVEERERREK